ncbi:Dolichyl-phosphate-mannose--protein mannosyltransferase 6, partial [Dictyocoela roeselum]
MSGFLFNQDLNFSFESGVTYPENMDYVGMRMFHALFGSFIPVFVYLSLAGLGYDCVFSFVFSCLFVVENGFISISRLILLDSHLLFFTSLVVYLLVRYYRDRCKLNLFYLGIGLGCVMSIKWIGCLTTLMVGLFIIYELWMNLISKERIIIFIKMFLERALFLILVPVAIYVGLFVMHFKIVNKSSSDEAHMSSVFQSMLIGSPQASVNKYVEFGKIVSIKSSKMAGGNLHSHPHEYPEECFKQERYENGSKSDVQSDNENRVNIDGDKYKYNEDHKDSKGKDNTNSEHANFNNGNINTNKTSLGNQVTTYSHRDTNNHWAFQKVVEENIDVDFVHD